MTHRNHHPNETIIDRHEVDRDQDLIVADQVIGMCNTIIKKTMCKVRCDEMIEWAE